MNWVRRMCATTLLTVVLAASPALAGDMPGGVTSPPPRAEVSATGQMPGGITSTSPSSEASVIGEMPQGLTSAIDPVTEFALTLVQSLLSLF